MAVTFNSSPEERFERNVLALDSVKDDEATLLPISEKDRKVAAIGTAAIQQANNPQVNDAKPVEQLGSVTATPKRPHIASLPPERQPDIQHLLAELPEDRRAKAELLLEEIKKLSPTEQKERLKELAEVFQDAHDTLKQKAQNLIENGSTQDLIQAISTLSKSKTESVKNVSNEIQDAADRKGYIHLHPLLSLFQKHLAIEKDGAGKIEVIKGKIQTHEHNLQQVLKTRSLAATLDEDKDSNPVPVELKKHLVQLKQNGIEIPGLLQSHSLKKLTKEDVKELIQRIETIEKADIEDEAQKVLLAETKALLKELDAKNLDSHDVSEKLKERLAGLKNDHKIELFELENISKKDLKRLTTELDNHKDTIHFQVQKMLSTELEPILKSLQILADIMKKNVDEHNGLMRALLEAMRR